jgi:hypothetical protein
MSTLVPIFTALFNMAIDTCMIPSEWKSAVVTPIYKNKGLKTDVNSYRGILVLPPVAKLFEKVQHGPQPHSQLFRRTSAANKNREIVIFFLAHQAWRAARECPKSTLLSSLHQRTRLIHT